MYFTFSFLIQSVLKIFPFISLSIILCLENVFLILLPGQHFYSLYKNMCCVPLSRVFKGLYDLRINSYVRKWLNILFKSQYFLYLQSHLVTCQISLIQYLYICSAMFLKIFLNPSAFSNIWSKKTFTSVITELFSLP